VGERLEQRLTGLCLTADGCDTPRDGGPAELEHCKRGCWAETRFNSLAQKWAVDTGSLENRREAVVNGSSKSLCLRVKNTSSVDIDLYEDSPSVFLGECLPAGAVGATQWTLIDHQRGMQGNSKYSLLRAEGKIDPDLCPDPPCCLTTAGMEKSVALHAMTAQIFIAMVLPSVVVAAPLTTHQRQSPLPSSSSQASARGRCSSRSQCKSTRKCCRTFKTGAARLRRQWPWWSAPFSVRRATLPSR